VITVERATGQLRMRKENVGTKIVCINVIWHIVRACNTPSVSPRACRSVQDAHPGSWITVWIFRLTLKKKKTYMN